MEQRGITNVLLGLISILLFALLLTQTCRVNKEGYEIDNVLPTQFPQGDVAKDSESDANPKGNTRPRIHLLSDVSGRLYMREDLNPAPRDLDIIREIILTILTSPKSYGVSLESIMNQDDLDSLSIIQSPDYTGNYAKKFPNVLFSKLRSVQSENYAIISPHNIIDRFKYRSEPDQNKRSLRGDTQKMCKGVKDAYRNYDSKGVNTIAALEKYISKTQIEDGFHDVYVVLTDGYVNTNLERVWSPSQIAKARRDSVYMSTLFRESEKYLGDGKIILLETGGRDFDPMIGVKDEITDNDVLKELWVHWAKSAGFKEIIWKTKWDAQISRDWVEKKLLD